MRPLQLLPFRGARNFKHDPMTTCMTLLTRCVRYYRPRARAALQVTTACYNRTRDYDECGGFSACGVVGERVGLWREARGY